MLPPLFQPRASKASKRLQPPRVDKICQRVSDCFRKCINSTNKPLNPTSRPLNHRPASARLRPAHKGRFAGLAKRFLVRASLSIQPRCLSFLTITVALTAGLLGCLTVSSSKGPIPDSSPGSTLASTTTNGRTDNVQGFSAKTAQIQGVNAGQAAIASAHPLATQAGLDILKQGGNAFDAAIAVAATLGVVEPYSAGIGGGGFWLLYDVDGLDNQGEPLSTDPRKRHYRFLDAREKAPGAAHRTLYQNAQGDVIPQLSTKGPLAAAIPGQAAAFVALADKYGQLPLSTSLAPAIKHAQQGFAVGRLYVNYLQRSGYRMRDYPESRTIFYKRQANGQYAIPKVGDRIIQIDLANTLKALAAQGFAGFYQGEVAERMVAAVRTHGGIWTLDDLAQYQVIERDPIRFDIGEYQFISAPPPSSGGVALATLLNVLDLKQYWQLESPLDQTHLLIEAMRLAYRDRAAFLGDSDFVEVDLDKLTSRTHANTLASKISMEVALQSADLGEPLALHQGQHTTHFSIMDQYGNKVAATLSINLSFGSGFVAKDTGVLLNNEMDDFSAKPGVPNAFGLIGSEANAIAAYKRPLSSMTPTMIASDHGVAVLGGPGGSRIISMVLLAALEHMAGNPLQDWVARPRLHHQYLPDKVVFEATDNQQALNPALQQGLRARGHQLSPTRRNYGNMQVLWWDANSLSLSAASDPRGEGQAKALAIVLAPLPIPPYSSPDHQQALAKKSATATQKNRSLETKPQDSEIPEPVLQY